MTFYSTGYDYMYAYALNHAVFIYACTCDRILINTGPQSNFSAARNKISTSFVSIVLLQGTWLSATAPWRTRRKSPSLSYSYSSLISTYNKSKLCIINSAHLHKLFPHKLCTWIYYTSLHVKHPKSIHLGRKSDTLKPKRLFRFKNSKHHQESSNKHRIFLQLTTNSHIF